MMENQCIYFLYSFIISAVSTMAQDEMANIVNDRSHTKLPTGR